MIIRIAASIAFVMAIVAGCASQTPAVSEDEELRAIIADATEEKLDGDPTLRTKLKADGRLAIWTPVTDEARAKDFARVERRLAELKAEIDVEALTPDARLDYETYKSSLEYEALYARAINDGSLLYVNVLEPSVDNADLLVSSHAIHDVGEAENFIARLYAFPSLLNDTLEAMKARHGKGVVMMKSAYAQVANRAGAYARGAPCNGDGNHPFASAFAKRLEGAEINADDKTRLTTLLDTALTQTVCPAYVGYVEAVTALGAAGRDEAAWALPEGERFYGDAIELSLGERVDPKRIHETGLAEVEKIKSEMEGLIAKTGFEGSFAEFNEFLRAGGGGSLPNTTEGRAEYIDSAQALIDELYERMPEYFSLVPKTQLEIVVPDSGPLGGPPSASPFYGEAPADGSRPATLFLGAGTAPQINTWPLGYAVAHEITPGHHHQTETFRAMSDGEGYPRPFYPGYFDGWAMYAEELAEEMGVYDDDIYSRIGWRQGQLTRAIRMVIDTGLNAEQWTQEEATAYQTKNGATVERLNRFLIWPGQGLSYYWGYLEFTRLRREAEERLGDKFDIKEFHETVLKIGPVPLEVLDRAVNSWIDAKLGE